MNHKYSKLKKWVVSNGGTVHPSLRLKETEYGNALYATDDINGGDVLLKVPENLRINSDKFKDIPNINHASFSEVDKDCLTIISLLYNTFILKETSFFRPYINLLPTFDSYSYHPLVQYNADTKKVWENINSNITARIEILISQYEHFKKLIRESKIFPENTITDDNIKWGYLSLKTRQWKNHGFVPVADLMQHSNRSDMLLSVVDNVGCMTTNSKVSKGDLLYDNYGLFDDFQIFCSFGFVEGDLKSISNGTDTSVRMIRIDLNSSVDMTKALGRFKHFELEKYKELQKSWFLTNIGLCQSLLEYLRIAAITDNDIKLINFNTKYYETLISLDNESKTYSWVKQLLITDDKYKEQLKKCIDICKNAKTDTIEYKIACLSIVHNIVIEKTDEILNSKWMSYINQKS